MGDCHSYSDFSLARVDSGESTATTARHLQFLSTPPRSLNRRIVPAGCAGRRHRVEII